MKVIVRVARAGVLLALIVSLSGCAELARKPKPIPTRSPVPPTVTAAPTPTPEPPPSLSPEPSVTPTATSLPVAGCSETVGRVDFGQLPSRIARPGQVAYAIYFPPCYDTRLRYPVVYLLHGSPSFDERHWLNLGLKDALDRAIASQRVPPFLVVLPRGDIEGTFGFTSGGDGSWEQVMVDEVIPYIDTTYNTLAAPEGRAIGGISRGAVWALEIAFRRPDLFRSVGSHSAALAVAIAAPPFNPLAIAQTDQAAALKDLRILLDAGDADWALQKTAELHAILDERGVPNTLLVGRGPHDSPYWSSQLDAYVDFYGSGFDGLMGAGGSP